MARKVGLTLGALVIAGGALWLAWGRGGGGIDKRPETTPPSVMSSTVVAHGAATVGKTAKVEGRNSSLTPATLAPMPERVDRARARWELVARGVRKLDSSDQAGLDLLYAQAQAAIRADEDAWLEAVSGSMGAVIGASFEESFFTVSAWIRSSQAPAKILDAIWQYEPPADVEAADAHHPVMTQALRYERVEAYGVRELRQRVEQGKTELGASEASRMIAALLPRATRERSLNLSIELFQLLSALHAPEEVVQSALQGHSERDRQLLQGILNAH